MFLEFTDPTSRSTSGGIKIGIHGIKVGKFRMDLPSWAGVFSDLVTQGHQPGDAALAATAEQVRQNPAALQAGLFGSGHDPNKFWDLLAAIFAAPNSGALTSSDAANAAVMQAEDGSRTSTGPLLLVGGIVALLFVSGGFKRFLGGGSRGRRRSFKRRGIRRRLGRLRRNFRRAGAKRRYNRNLRAIFGRRIPSSLRLRRFRRGRR